MTQTEKVFPAKYADIPDELKALPQWVVWKLIDRGERKADGSPKMTKVPCDPKKPSANASSTNLATWGTFEQACARQAAKGSPFAGIGFVFTEGDPYCGIDLDGCCSEEKGIADWASHVLLQLDSYAEYSPSGKGIHIITKGKKPGDKCKITGYGGPGGDIELYDRGRFFCMTEKPVPGFNQPVQDRQGELEALYAKLFPDKEPEPRREEQPAKPKKETRSAGDPASLSDDDLLALAFNAKNGSKFRELWEGNTAAYGGDDSRADLALCCELAFWTDRDRDRVDRLFRRSALYRSKWDRQDYANRTIEQALEKITEGYKGSKQRRSTRSAKGRREDPPPALEEAKERYHHLTDLGNCRRFVQQFGEIIRYCEPEKSWIVFDGIRWAANNAEAHRLAKKTVLNIHREAAEPELHREERKLISKHAIHSENVARIDALLSLAKSEPLIPIEPTEFDRDPMLFNVPNGTLDLATGELLPHRKEDMITHLSPVEYDPSAECPLWLKILTQNMEGDEELIGYLERFAGYCLTGLMQEEAFWVFYGGGRNGKSLFVSTLMRIYGTYARQTDSRTFIARDRRDTSPRDDLADLVGIRFAPSSELSSGGKLDIGLVKAITGQDIIRCRRLYQAGFEYSPCFKLTLVSNHRPSIAETSQAAWERVRLVPFNYFVPAEERDPNLRQKLAEELPGILAWAVRGCLSWQRIGLQSPKSVVCATGSYREDEDLLSGFLEARCVLSAGARVPVSELYSAYKVWATENDEHPVGKRTLHDRLVERGLHTGRGAHNIQGWYGIGLQTGRQEEIDLQQGLPGAEAS